MLMVLVIVVVVFASPICINPQDPFVHADRIFHPAVLNTVALLD